MTLTQRQGPLIVLSKLCLVIKSVKSTTLTSQQALAYVLAGNFLNINGMLAALGLTGSFIVFYPMLNNGYVVKTYDNYPIPPPGVLLTTAFILVFQIRPYFTNHALRWANK